MSNLSRRSLVASAAALPALAAPAVAVAAFTEPDPIFAAIEAHRVAFMRNKRDSRTASELAINTPEEKAAAATEQKTYKLYRTQCFALASTIPTTMAGIVALTAYVDDFRAGKIALPEDPEWTSDWFWLGEWDDGAIEKDDEPPSYAFLMMRNIGTALQRLAVQS